MVDIVIGDERSNLSLSVPNTPRLWSEARLEIFDAFGSFRVEGFRGEFQTMLSAPVTRDLAKHLASFIDGSTSTLTWWGGIDHAPDFQIELVAKDEGKVNASVAFNTSMLSATAQAYRLQSTEWSFSGELFFRFDRHLLSATAASLNALQFEASQ
jgi:hypothetical protein